MRRPKRPWRVLQRTVALDAPPHLTVWRERIALPEGRGIDDYYEIGLRDFAILMAVTADDRVVLLERYRHAVHATCLTFPGALLEPGEDPEGAVRRQLLAEAGLACDHVVRLGSFVMSGHHRGATGHVFYGQAAPSALQPPSTGQGADAPLLMPFEQLSARVGRRGFNLMPDVMALGLALMHRAQMDAAQRELARPLPMD